MKVLRDEDGRIKDDLRAYLKAQYDGVLNDKQIQRQIEDYVGFAIAEKQLEHVLQTAGQPKKIIDIGCGFGSFVYAARKKEIKAVGIDIAEFEIDFARRRLSREPATGNPDEVYRIASGLDLPFQAESFDVVTMWNILEHVQDYKRLLKEAYRVLAPGGLLYIVCPNYFALRREAHYFVFWPLFLPKACASVYLKMLGKKPDFFKKNIFYRLNWPVLAALRALGMRLFDARETKLLRNDLITSGSTKRILLIVNKLNMLWLVKILLRFSFYNPFKSSIELYAKK
jgi:MPBQ/MSBQ methyltransferase